MKNVRGRLFGKNWNMAVSVAVSVLIFFSAVNVPVSKASGYDGQPNLQGENPLSGRSVQLQAGMEAGNSSSVVIAATGSVLLDQMDYVGSWGIVSQNYEYDAWDIEAADDFTVPASDETWTIESLDVFGFCGSIYGEPLDCGSLASANVYIYSSAGSLPGTLVYSSELAAVTSGPLVNAVTRQYTVNLTNTALLQAGTYWISMQVNMNSYVGDWLWQERYVQSGNTFALRNPGGGWGGGCTSWCGGQGVEPDLNFRINGKAGNIYKVELPTGEAYNVVEHGVQPFAYASIPAGNVVAVVNTSTETVITTIPVGSNPKGLAISPDSNKVYVAVGSGSAIKVIDTATNTVINTFALGFNPINLAYGGPGRLYVSGAGTIRGLDPSNGSEILALPSSPYDGDILAMSPNGQSLCSGASGISPSSVACYNITTDSPPAPLTKFNIGSNLHTLDISGDGSLLYAAGGYPYYVTALYLDSLNQAGQFNTGAYPDSAFDSPDGKVLFATGGDGSWLWSTQTYLHIKALDNPGVKFLATGRDNHTGYATAGNLLIYHFPTFSDVPWKYWSRSFIERLYNAGITGGCSITPLLYCPGNTVNRAQMAVFLLRGIHGSGYTPPAVGVGTGFTDVPSDHPMAAWIKQLAAEGITGGCGNGRYCPDAPVTRAQMAVFLLRSKYTSAYTPPPANGDFTDVPLNHSLAAWIEQLAAEGITGGCGAGVYCPDGNVTRDQMAIFLVRTFNLP